MSHVYPRAPEAEPAIAPVSDATLASRILTHREDEDEELTKEQVVGLVLQGEGTVTQFNRVWDEVEAERVAMRSVSPANHATSTSFNTALAAVAKRLDPASWYEGLKAELKVTTWADLKAAFTPKEPQEL